MKILLIVYSVRNFYRFPKDEEACPSHLKGIHSSSVHYVVYNRFLRRPSPQMYSGTSSRNESPVGSTDKPSSQLDELGDFF